MAEISPFELHTDQYEQWFEAHPAAYVSELLALRPFVPLSARGVEIGVGTGRFAGPLGVPMGLDPSEAMLRRAAARGIETVQGRAEALPFPDASFDYALIVTTLCFVESPTRLMREAHRVLRPSGRLVLGFIDRESELGRSYLERQAESVFYRGAKLYSATEVNGLLQKGGFLAGDWVQTLSHPLNTMVEIEPARTGTGSGGFVVTSAKRLD